jgi:hypothetical protein
MADAVSEITRWCDEQNIPYPTEIIVYSNQRISIECEHCKEPAGDVKGLYNKYTHVMELWSKDDLDCAWHEFLHHLGIMRHGDEFYYLSYERK